MKEDLKNGKEKGGKEENKEKSDKTHVKIPLKSLNTPQKSTKTGKNFRGGGKNFSGWPEYIPLEWHFLDAKDFQYGPIPHSLRLLLPTILFLSVSNEVDFCRIEWFESVCRF